MDTLRLPARGSAPLHTPCFSKLLDCHLVPLEDWVPLSPGRGEGLPEGHPQTPGEGLCPCTPRSFSKLLDLWSRPTLILLRRLGSDLNPGRGEGLMPEATNAGHPQTPGEGAAPLHTPCFSKLLDCHLVPLEDWVPLSPGRGEGLIPEGHPQTPGEGLCPPAHPVFRHRLLLLLCKLLDCHS